MFNKIIISLFLALIYFQTIHASDNNVATNVVVMKKEEVLKLDTKIGEDGKCPNTLGTILSSEKNTKYCHYNIYCKADDTCYGTNILKDGNLYYDNISSIIVEDEKGKHSYSIDGECKSDYDCLSGVCIAKNKGYYTCDTTKITQCVVPRDNSLSIHCGKPSFSKCMVNDECASKICKDGKCSFVLEEEYNNSITKMLYSNLILCLVGLCVCIGLLCTLCCCFIKKRREKNNTRREKNNTMV